MPGRDNFAVTLWTSAQASLDQPFLIDGDVTWTYREFFETVRRFAGGLQGAGALPGDRVVVQVEKSPEAVALYVACLWAGVVHVPLNPRFTAVERAYFVADSDPRVVVTDEGSVIDPVRATDQDGDDRTWLTLGSSGTGSLPHQAAITEPVNQPVDRGAHDLAAILYTSGTTGQPKGASLTHQSLRANSEALRQAWRFDPSDQLVHVLPIFHVHGLFVALHCAMLTAIPVRFHRRFDPAPVIADLAESTVFMGVPTHYIRLAENPALTPSSCARMRLFTCGSAPLTVETFQRFQERSGHTICERYGMSETGITLSNPYDGPRLPGTVGYPLDGVEAMVVDDQQQPTEPDTIGVLAIRSRQIMVGYWGRPDATADAMFGDHWFLTGDVASMADDGRVTLHGRIGDMIISGGENIYPKDIEQVLDAVAGINESAVIGVPDPDLGERVVAVITGPTDSLTLSDIQSVLDQKLARFKHPRQLFWVDELPRNAMGKVQKAELRQRYQSVP